MEGRKWRGVKSVLEEKVQQKIQEFEINSAKFLFSSEIFQF